MYELNQCAPTREQMWLLKTALQQGKPAQQAWQAWCTHVNLDDVDLASYHLLPLVYHNLYSSLDANRNLGQDKNSGSHHNRTMAHLTIENELFGRLKGIYRHTWSKNKMLFYHAEEVVTQLAMGGIDTMFLHGAAMAVGYYPTEGTRLLTAIDILVRQEQFLTAVARLEAAGWQVDSYSATELQQMYQHRIRPSVVLCRGKIVLNVHYMLLPMVQQNETRYWENARCHRWRGQSVYLLSPTQQLFHTCVHGMTWSGGYLTWIPDALSIVAQAEQPNREVAIDWQSLIQLAETTRKILPLHNALTFLAEEFQAPIPATVLKQLAAIPVTFAERLEYHMLGRAAGAGNRIQRILVAASRYRVLHCPESTPLRLSLTAWIPYMFRQWRLGH